MLQNKLSFNQSSASLEIIGLPDYSNNEGKNQISIISNWKLTIIDNPLIEGNVDHLISIMQAFYTYSNFLIYDQIASYESDLIDIKADNLYTHNILLKSSKTEVPPLNIKIGNSGLSDIINCFDQLICSNKILKISSNQLNFLPKKRNFIFNNKRKIFHTILPPLLSLCSLFFVSSTFIYLNNLNQENEKNVYVD